MSKVDDNKKQKESTLLETAFHLFHRKKDLPKQQFLILSNRPGLAKGTFYLYFKDKYDLRDKLIVYKANQLFDDAHRALEKSKCELVLEG